MHLGRGLVGLDAAEHDLMGQHRRRTECVDHQARIRCTLEVAAEAGTRLHDRLVSADRRLQGRTCRAAQGLADPGELAVAGMHHHVATDHRQATEGAMEAHVLGAVRIDDDVAGGEGIATGTAHRDRAGADDGQGAVDGRGLGGCRGIGGTGNGEAGDDRQAQQAVLHLHGELPVVMVAGLAAGRWWIGLERVA